MDIEYVSSYNKSDMCFEFQGNTYSTPLITLACVNSLEATEKSYHVVSSDNAINRIRRVIKNVVNHPDLDEAIKVTIGYEGESFHHSMCMKEGLVYGKYSFLAEFFKKPCKIAMPIDDKIKFVDPSTVLSSLHYLNT